MSNRRVEVEEGEEPDDDLVGSVLGKHRAGQYEEDRECVKQIKSIAESSVNTIAPSIRQLDYDTVDGERNSYEIWLKAIKAAAYSVLLPSTEKKAEANRLLLEWQDHIEQLQTKYITHDPINRHFRSYDPNIDSALMSCDDTTALKPDLILQNFRPYTSPSAVYGTMAPLYSIPAAATNTQFVTSRCKSCYYLQLLYPGILSFNSVVKPLAQHLIRRYHDRYASRMAVLLLSDSMNEEKTLNFDIPNDCQVRCYIVPSSYVSGVAVNGWIKQQTMRNVDLCVFMHHDVADSDANDEFIRNLIIEKGIDTFIPSYPVILSNDVMVLTPIQLVQINGCVASCADIASVIQSFCSRISIVLGALLCSTTYKYQHGKKLDEFWYSSGLHDQESFQDGRVHLINLLNGGYNIADLQQGNYLRPATESPPPSYLATHIPWCKHGTFVNDCKINIFAAIKCYRPRVLVILGSEYGKITRFIMDNCDEHSVIFCVDEYKNRATSDNFATTTSTENKFDYNYLQYESFVSSIEGYGNELGKSLSIYTMKFEPFTAIEFLRYRIVPVDLVYISDNKDTDKLYTLILQIITYYPDATIIGHDYNTDVGNSVVKNLQISNPYLLRDDSYLILPRRRYVPEIKPFIELATSKFIKTTNTIGRYINELVISSSDSSSVSELEAFLLAHDIFAPLDDPIAITHTIMHIFLNKYLQLHEENTKPTSLNIGSFNEVLKKKKFYTDIRQLLLRIIDQFQGSVGVNENFTHVFDVLISNETIMP